MKLWQSIKQALGQGAAIDSGQGKAAGAPLPVPPRETEPEELAPPPELEPAQVQEALAGAQPPLLLDVREQYEWDQVRIPAALHIPMSEVPDRLGELPRQQAIVVFCAHGSRSFDVAYYLLEQGLDAASLRGGITQWYVQGGTVETGK